MALMAKWPMARNEAGTLSHHVLGLVAGTFMVGLAAAVYFLRPEGSLAIMVGLLVLLVALTNLRWALLLFVFLDPFIPISWGVDLVSWMPYLTAERLCCLALCVMFVHQSKAAWDTPRMKRIATFLLGLMTVQTLAACGAHDALAGFKASLYDALQVYVPFLISAHLFRTKAQVRVLLTVVLIAMSVVAVLAIVEHTIDYNFYDSFVAAREDMETILTTADLHRGGYAHARRARVAFGHPILLGLHLMCLFFVAVYFLYRRGIVQRLFLLAGLPLFSLALLYTYSRGPLLGLICGLAWLAMIGRGTRPWLFVLVLCSLAGYLLMPSMARDVLVETIATSTDITTGASLGGGDVRDRLNLLHAGLQYSQRSLWFGLGPEVIRKQTTTGSTGATVDFSSVDNFYLAVLLEHGIVVLALIAGFFLYLLVWFTRAASRLADRELALLAAITASMCVANFVAMGTVGFNITLFWILLGAAVRVTDLSPRLEGGRAGRPRGGLSAGGSTLQGRARSTHEVERYPVVGQQRQRVPTGGEERVMPFWASAPGGFFGRLSRRAAPRSAGLVLVTLLIALAVAAPALAAPSFYGTTGLFATPTAAVAPRGAWSLGSNYVGRNFRPGASSLSQGTVANFFTFTMLPRLELTVVLTNYEGKLGTRDLNHGLTPDFNLGGYTVDRTASTQWLAMPQHGYRPSLAFGLRDFLGRPAKHLQAQYAVMSLNHGPLTLTAGLGTLALRGPFGGVEYALSPHVSLLAEGLQGGANGGFRLLPLRDVQLDVAMMGFSSLGGGLSYRRKF